MATTARPRLRVRARAPELLLAFGTLVLAGLAASIAADIVTVSFDESLHKRSAVRYTGGLANVFDDPTARATARLYSLVISPFFATFDGDTAVRSARAFGAVLYCTATLPAYLLARRVLTSPWAAAGAAFLAVAAPWLAITTVLYTEVLAYPLFLWTVWAILRAFEAPSWRRDLIAVALIVAATCTRFQFAALLLGYWVAIAVVARTDWRRFPFGVASLALAVPVALVASTGDFLGGYEGIFEQDVPDDFFLSALVEVVNFGFGVGILPLALAGAWYWVSVGRRDRFAVVTTVLLGALCLVTLIAQGGFLGDETEERYFVYVVPFAWIAAFAAVEGRRVDRRTLLVACGAMALLFASLKPLTRFGYEGWFLGPAAAAAQHVVDRMRDSVTGITHRDVLFLLAVTLTAAVAAVWWRGARARWIVAIGIPAVIQLSVTLLVFNAARGEVSDAPTRTGEGFAQKAWIDRAASDDAIVTWFNNQATGTGASEQVESVFWNDRLLRVTGLPDVIVSTVAPPMDSLGTTTVDQIPGQPVVQSADSPLVQLRGRRIATSPDGRLELMTPEPGLPQRWRARDLPGDGYILFGAGSPVEVSDPEADAFEVEMKLRGNPGGPTSARLELGGRSANATVAPDGDAILRVAACARGGRLSGTVSAQETAVLPDRRGAGPRIEAVRVTPVNSATSTGPDRCPDR